MLNYKEKKSDRLVPSNFEHLKALVATGQVKLLWELSLPRSNSTAWQIAICEAPEIKGQINEPSFHSDLRSRSFHLPSKKGDRSLEEYCGRILERLEGSKEKGKLGLFADEDERPVNLVINDLVTDIRKVDLEAILPLTRKIAITIRDPRLQAYSALTRTLNDALDAPGGGNISPAMALYLSTKTHFTKKEFADLLGPGKDKVNPATILRFLKQPEVMALTPELLLEAISLTVAHCKKDYVDICWDNFKQQMQYIKKHARTGTAITVIDGSDLTEHPISIMQQSSKALGITYMPAMVYQWRKSSSKKFYCCVTEGWGELAVSNHWNGPARNSKRLERKPSSIADILALEIFPLVMQDSIKDALKIYQQISQYKIKPAAPTSTLSIETRFGQYRRSETTAWPGFRYSAAISSEELGYLNDMTSALVPMSGANHSLVRHLEHVFNPLEMQVFLAGMTYYMAIVNSHKDDVRQRVDYPLLQFFTQLEGHGHAQLDDDSPFALVKSQDDHFSKGAAK